jgi:hypothetical protein
VSEPDAPPLPVIRWTTAAGAARKRASWLILAIVARATLGSAGRSGVG